MNERIKIEVRDKVLEMLWAEVDEEVRLTRKYLVADDLARSRQHSFRAEAFTYAHALVYRGLRE